jgi:hypothetical protein
MNICAEDTQKKNLGKSKCTKLPKLFKYMITTPDNFFLAAADYADAAALKTAIQNLILNPIATRGYKWPNFSAVEETSEDAQYEDNALGITPIRDGQYRFKPSISKNLCVHQAMFSHRAVNEGRVFLVDLDNQLFGTDDGTGNIYGFSIGLLWTEKLKISNGSDSTKSPLYLVLADNEEIDKNGVLLDGSKLNFVEPLTDVTLTVAGAFVATAFKVDVKQTCDGTPVQGLALADFLLYAADGVTLQTILSVVADANVPGRYTLTAPTVGPNPFESGTLYLRAPSALTVKAYETPEAMTVTIP